MFLCVFQDLPTGLLALCNAALKQDNKVKNRYNDIIACKLFFVCIVHNNY